MRLKASGTHNFLLSLSYASSIWSILLVYTTCSSRVQPSIIPRFVGESDKIWVLWRILSHEILLVELYEKVLFLLARVAFAELLGFSILELDHSILSWFTHYISTLGIFCTFLFVRIAFTELERFSNLWYDTFISSSLIPCTSTLGSVLRPLRFFHIRTHTIAGV